jgi:hypothetical protein
MVETEFARDFGSDAVLQERQSYRDVQIALDKPFPRLQSGEEKMKRYQSFLMFAFVFVALGTFTSEAVYAQGGKGTVRKLNGKKAVPKNWDYIYDKKKGYGFYVPSASSTETIKVKGVDIAVINTGAVTDVDIFVLAFKDKTLTKDDLLVFAVEFLEGLGQTVTPGELQAEDSVYAVADATTVLEDGSKGKLRILVGTDITDNYIMIIGATPKNFAANEEMIDTIWGSFEMWSGGGVAK